MSGRWSTSGFPPGWSPFPCPPFGDPENRLSRARKSVRGNEVVLLGSMREFQFQVNHPRYGVGAEFSLLDMQNATLDCQVELDLRFVDAQTGELLWKGTLFSEEERNVHVAVPGTELEQAAGLLSANLRKVILQAIGKWSALGY
ncbi:MAG: CsgG/HfaB family protein [Nitrospirota bacterium]|nr:CsgG/HfaB family protein [Nitrospirota bacterium]